MKLLLKNHLKFWNGMNKMKDPKKRKFTIVLLNLNFQLCPPLFFKKIIEFRASDRKKKKTDRRKTTKPKPQHILNQCPTNPNFSRWKWKMIWNSNISIYANRSIFPPQRDLFIPKLAFPNKKIIQIIFCFVGYHKFKFLRVCFARNKPLVGKISCLFAFIHVIFGHRLGQKSQTKTMI